MKKFHRYIPLPHERLMQSYVFRVELEQEVDERWSAWIEALPGCATWGYTREEAFDALKDAAQAYIEALLANKQRIPVEQGIETINAPVVTVTI